MGLHTYNSVSYMAFVAGFCAELQTIKEKIASASIERYLGQQTETNDLNTQCSLILARLKGVLVEQEAYVREVGTEEEIRWYRTVQYSLAAYADEVLLIVFDWDGNSLWSSYLLEKALFKTDMAGNTLFKWIDRALRSNDTSPIHREVVSVYLVLLQLGFRGRYRNDSNNKRLKEYKRQLLQLIGLPPDRPKSAPAFSDAYRIAEGDLRVTRATPASRWIKRWLAVFVVYLIVSSALWQLLVLRVMKIAPGGAG